MRIDRMLVEDLRMVQTAELRFAPGLNFLVGANGAILTRANADSPFTATAFETASGETPLLSGVLPVDGAGYLVIGDKGADLYRPQ